MPKMRSRVRPLVAGPWQGVRDTTDPGDDAPRYLARLTNGYVPDPEGGSGAYARLSTTAQGGSFTIVHVGSGVFDVVAST